ncbi:MAG: putative glycoside hydrolase, partial [Erythrobacter sp.]
SEGAGIADVLTGAVPATGKLGFSWPASCDYGPLNGPEGALFPLGYGRSLEDTSPLATLDESCAPMEQGAALDWYVNGRLADGVLANTATGKLDNLRGQAGGITATGLDRTAQEDARTVTFAPGASLELAQGGGGTGYGYRILYEVASRPQARVTLKVGSSDPIDITQQLSVAEGKSWREMVITSSCAANLGPTLAFASDGAFTINIGTIEREEFAAGTDCSF